MSKVILLVDDDSDFRESVRDILEFEGFEIIEAEDGKYALPILEKESVDLVITDILMPEIEGIGLVSKIKQLKPDLRVIGMTGGGRLGSAEKVKNMCTHFSFQTVLSKPFLAEDLIAEVEAALF